MKTYNGRINSILELSECGVNVYPQGLRPILAVVVLAIPESTYICIWRRISSLQPSTFQTIGSRCYYNQKLRTLKIQPWPSSFYVLVWDVTPEIWNLQQFKIYDIHLSRNPVSDKIFQEQVLNKYGMWFL